MFTAILQEYKMVRLWHLV